VRPATITAVELRARLDRLESAGVALRAMSLDERIAALDRVAAGWRDPCSSWRRDARAALARTTGYAPAAVEYALDHLWRALGAHELAAVAARELGAEARQPERLAFHSLAGNVPGVGVFGIAAALVTGVPSLVKTARREPELLGIVAASLAEANPLLGDAVAVAYWAGGSDAQEEIAIAGSSVVLAYGRADTLDRLATRAPQRLLRFGPRLSIALVAREAADARTAAVAAHQVALFDQQGCLSPQYLVLEESDVGATNAFLHALADALGRLAALLPRATLGLDEAAHAWHFVEHQRWRQQEGAAVHVLGDADATFSVVCDRTGALPGGPLNRHLVVIPVASLMDARLVVARLDGMVEAVGVEAPGSRLAEAAAVAAACGAQRLCPLERMQAPPFAWRQSGHARLASFLVPAASGAAAANAGTGAASIDGGADACEPAHRRVEPPSVGPVSPPTRASRMRHPASCS
jgi:hypothetical protein